MVADCTELRFVTASVRRAARLQRDYADTFLEDARGGRALIGRQFAELCDRICEMVSDYEREYKQATDHFDRKLILNALQELLARTRDLQALRAWIDAAAAPAIDLGSFYYLAGLAKAIVREDAELTVVATHQGSYATVVNPFRQPAQPPPEGIVLVALVPRREMRTGFLHPLLAHEIGHGVAKVHGFVEQMEGQLEPDALEDILDVGAEAQSKQSRKSANAERAMLIKRLAAWREEIFCDAIGVACLGATYLFSFATEVLPDDIDSAGLKHPPTRQRVRLIIEHLDRLGWTDVLKSEVPDFMRWVREIASTAPAPQGPADEALRKAVDLIGTHIQDKVDAHLGELVFQPDRQTLAAVAELIAQHVPPAQLDDGRPIDRPTIIVGCWLAALKSGGGSIDALASAVDSAELAKLLPYALELSVIVDKWQSVA